MDYRLKDIEPHQFRLLPGHVCKGCYFKENKIDCTQPETADYMRAVFSQGTGTGSCKYLIAVLETDEVNK